MHQHIIHHNINNMTKLLPLLNPLPSGSIYELSSMTKCLTYRYKEYVCSALQCSTLLKNGILIETKRFKNYLGSSIYQGGSNNCNLINSSNISSKLYIYFYICYIRTEGFLRNGNRNVWDRNFWMDSLGVT